MRKKIFRSPYLLANRMLAPLSVMIRPLHGSGKVKSVKRTEGYVTLLARLPPNCISESRSQYGQDLLVVGLLGSQRGRGFFVEFGAINGIHNSNSYLLEKEFGWSGILSEPSRRWHAQLERNRKCIIDTRCVFSESGKRLAFGDTGVWAGGNTLVEYRVADGNERRFSEQYEVETVSLNDLLGDGGAPEIIDFISIDTEGSEYEILKTFDFSRFKFRLMVVEHNFVVEKRAAIQSLMEVNGYRRLPIDPVVAKVDDWYASDDVYKRFSALLP